ncbi:MAG: M3 family oligoendopeptidase [Microscillaceae bacterium]|nr:M3 family oligoendopeptidase [Microscillaceae bacterium]MDW8459980.1 M3 family oligoendopeptidase [Cytophagales bacterium]
MTTQNSVLEIPQKPTRQYLPQDFSISKWENLAPYYEKLISQDIENEADLKQFLTNLNELEAVVSEELAWRYIRMTCHTDNAEYAQAFQYFVAEIEPKIAPLRDKLNKKLYQSPYLQTLAREQKPYFLLKRELQKEIEIYREENVPLLAEMQIIAQKYTEIVGAMTVEIEGREQTLQQASQKLQDSNRHVRKEVYFKIQQRRLQDKARIDEIMNQLVALRHKIAQNTGFDNYRDYMFKAKSRFDYTKEDCFAFHDSIEQTAVPLLDKIIEKKRKKLGVETFFPWDSQATAEGEQPLRPFENAQELLDKTIRCLSRLHPEVGKKLQIMQAMGHLDLESRKSKAAGGYNYPLLETGVPFIFMNAASLMRDVVTLLHESGHALHNFLTRDIPLIAFKSPPAEVAELASMTMELITMDFWDEFFENPQDLQRAKAEHLCDLLTTLPWVATIDKFQHWIYENPTHTTEQRTQTWVQLFDRFSDKITNWTGLEHFKQNLWQKQLHIFELPFYYIEYAMAQLGAIAIWKNYRENPQETLEKYFQALGLGSMATIPEIYQTAGIQFDFSAPYIASLMQFVKTELDKVWK